MAACSGIGATSAASWLAFQPLVIAIAALKQGPAVVRAWIDGRRAETERELEETKAIRLERRGRLEGWSAHGVNSYQVVLVTEPAEIDLARQQLASGAPTAYVVLRVTGAGDGGNANLARTLRQLIEEDGCIARRPSAGETEALRAGLDKMGIVRARY